MKTLKLNRKLLVETLEDLLTDEFDSSELVYETDEQLIIRIIEAAQYYKQEYNN
jgi:hypothetical protein